MIGVPGQSAPTVTGFSLDMKAHIHRHLVETARGLSAELAEGIAVAGPLALPKPDARGLGVFLARAVIGQQLSVKAARRIWGRVEEAAHAQGDHLLALLTEEHAPILKTCGVSARRSPPQSPPCRGPVPGIDPPPAGRRDGCRPPAWTRH